MKSWASGIALGLLMSTALPSVPVVAADSAEKILLDKANYWRLKDRPDLAQDALNQLLSLNPNQPDAIYQSGMLQVQQGNLSDAQRSLARLQQVAPGSSRIADLQNAIRAGQVSPNDLNEARRLAQSGQYSQATEKYQQTFRGAPPPTFGVEYYLTLAGTPTGWDEARRGLQRLAQNSPGDTKVKLALAQVNTFKAGTRAQGIAELRQLSVDPVVGQQATQAWRQALMWLGNGPQDRQLYNQYLAQHPEDTELRQHMARPAGRGAALRGPADPLTTASSAARVAGNTDLPLSEPLGSASPRTDLARPDLPRNEPLRSAPPRTDLPRTDLPRNEPPRSRVAAVERQRGADLRPRRESRVGEPTPLPTGITIVAARAAPAAPAVGAQRTRAEMLRNEAKAAEARRDTAQAAIKYQQAIATDPTDPWVRLDYARMLVRLGQAPQAYQLVDPAASGGSPDSWFASAIFDGEQDRYREALTKLDRVPPSGRSAEFNAFRERMLLTAELARAKQLGRMGYRAEARNVLMSLYNRPPVTADKTATIAAALSDIGDVQTALQIARPNPAGPVPAKASLDYAGLLLKGGYEAEAQAYMTQAETSGRLLPGDRRDLEHLKAVIASNRADQLRRRGDLAGAYDQISWLLGAYPNDPTLLMAAGRIYASAGQNGTAMRFFDAAFWQAPRDIDVIRGAIGGAIVAGDLERARGYLAQGMQVSPNNPRLYYLAAEIARASGDNGTAYRALQIARGLDTDQLGNPDALPTALPGARQQGLPANPFRRSSERSTSWFSFSLIGSAQAAELPPGLSSLLPAPLELSASSADSEDLSIPPNASDRPPRPAPTTAAAGASDPGRVHIAQMLGSTPGFMPAADATTAGSYGPPLTPQLAQMEPLPPPPLRGYQPPYYPSPYGRPVAAPAPQESLELDIERSMAAIEAETAPRIQGGFGFRSRSGESGLSRLNEIGVPIEASMSPFLTGAMRLQVLPTYLNSGSASNTALLRFGHDPLLAAARGSAVGLPSGGSQEATGVSLSAGYAYDGFAGEVGTSPLGFPVENLLGRVAFVWPGLAGVSTAYPTIPTAPATVTNPLQVRVEAVRQSVTDSLLSFAGTKDPVTGQVWGGVVRSGANVMVAYDDGMIGLYGGGGAGVLTGKSVPDNSERDGTIGGYFRPYRTANAALKIGLNFGYLGYDKNLRFFTWGQGGYFSPQNYLSFGVPVEYAGRSGRLSYLVGGSLGVQTFHERTSRYFPNDPASQAALQASGATSFYNGRTVTGPSFSVRGQLEYLLDRGFSVGALASVDNARDYTEGIGKIYLRKTFGSLMPSSAPFPGRPVPGSL